MRRLQSKGRMVLCALILLAGLLPVYHGHNLTQLAQLIMSEANNKSGITTTDALIVVIPLFLVPFFSMLLLLRSALRIPTRRVYTLVPLLFLLFAAGVLLMSEQRSLISGSSSAIFQHLQVGFFLAFFSATLLPFTRNQKRKRHRRRRTMEVVQTA